MDMEDDKYDGTTDLSEDAEADDDSSEEEFEVENFMNDGKHYSHDHPLRLMSRSCEDDKEEVGDDDDKLRSCKLCGVPILSCPSYTCSLGCKFFLHQPCALEFPTEFIHPTHICGRNGFETGSDRHNLRIQKASTNFIYKCEDCEFALHPLVAFPHVQIKTKHKSHPSHSLVVFCKEISCECDACGREQKGFFFYCGDCNFWIHPDCTILPNILQFPDHPYPFILAYSLPFYYVQGDCEICEKPLLLRHNGVYLSTESISFAHVTCGSRHKSASHVRLNSVQLPDDDGDIVFPSLVIRRYAKETNQLPPLANKKHSAADDDNDNGGSGSANEDDNSELTIQKYHKHHPLILLIDDDCGESSWNINLRCDLCTRPIHKSSSSFYKCGSCHFVSHEVCANILPMLKSFIRVELCRDPSAIFFNSVFYCVFCHRPCNGLCYYDKEDACLFMDLECMVAPSTINHASHSHAQHLLFRTSLVEFATSLPCCPDYSFIYDVYRCIVCDYYIHVSCAMLPNRIICHEYDEHPLYLVFTPIPTSISCCCFCEVCEEEIDLKYWLYRCGECDKWFHINCIPSVGYLSKVKFGETLSLPNSHIKHACDHDHPLSLTRMLTFPSQRCGCCNQIIKGLVDQMAFSCEKCQFWLHFSCAATSKTTQCPLRIYSDIRDAVIRRWGRKYLKNQ